MIKKFIEKLDTKAGLLHFVRNDRMAAFCHGSIPQSFHGSIPQSLRTSYKKTAFTLAEVLITLAIIGVVAALTIPNLIKSYQKKVTVENSIGQWCGLLIYLDGWKISKDYPW